MLRTKGITKAAFGESDGKKGGSGYAAVFGNLDRHGDVILPGAIKQSVLDDFLANGTVLLGHWQPLPIGYPTLALDDGYGLKTEWLYHSTAEAVDAWKVAKERAEAGKTTGLSIGFRIAPDGWKSFENGDQLVGWAASEGIALQNIEQIKARKSTTWAITAISELYEYSQVATPANPAARTDNIKSLFGDLSLRSGMTASDHLEATLLLAESVTKRLKEMSDDRAAKGRPLLAPERLKQAESLHSGLGELIATVKSGQVPDIDAEELSLLADSILMGITN